MSAHCAGKPKPDYYVVMLEFSRGREAVVDPEITRREIVARIISGEYPAERISFIDHITDDGREDVTYDVMVDCAKHLSVNAEDRQFADDLAQIDHDLKLRAEAS